MHVALAPMAYAIWLAFENLLVLISPKLHSKRLITYTNCCKKLFWQISSWMNGVPVRLIFFLNFAYCVSGNLFNVPKYWVTIITLTLCYFL